MDGVMLTKVLGGQAWAEIRSGVGKRRGSQAPDANQGMAMGAA